MKRLFLISTMLVVLISGLSFAGYGMEYYFLGGAGFPGGLFDWSTGLESRIRLKTTLPVKPELVSSLSLAMKTAEPGGYLGLGSAGFCVLARYDVKLPFAPGIKPFVSPGGGIHFQYSFSTSESALGKRDFKSVSAKAHIFSGVDIYLTENLFISGFGRITYPSDIILDSGFLMLGFAFR